MKIKNRDLILILIDKSTNAFGKMLGLTEDDKLNTALSITQSTIEDSFDIKSKNLSEKLLANILSKNLLNFDQAQILTNLLWTQAEILLKLNRPNECITHYEITLQLLKWKVEQPVEYGRLERKNKIIELETIISTLKISKQ